VGVVGWAGQNPKRSIAPMWAVAPLAPVLHKMVGWVSFVNLLRYMSVMFILSGVGLTSAEAIETRDLPHDWCIVAHGGFGSPGRLIGLSPPYALVISELSYGIAIYMRNMHPICTKHNSKS
jgi:hypothetical protein